MSANLIDRYLPADYRDSFCRQIQTNTTISPEKLLIEMFTRTPGWINALHKLRDILVKPFGLEVKRENLDISGAIKEKTNNEVVLGKDDKHLEFYVSLRLHSTENNIYRIEVTTIVRYHNRLGRIYFFFVRPIHKLIVPAMLKRVLKNYQV